MHSELDYLVAVTIYNRFETKLLKFSVIFRKTHDFSCIFR